MERPEFELMDEPPFRHTHLYEQPEPEQQPTQQQPPAPAPAPPASAGADEPAQKPQPEQPAPEPEPAHDVVAPAKNPVKPKKGAVSSSELRNMNFTLFGYDGEWGNHMGKVMIPFSMMVHGKPGSGKSTYCIKHAYHCAANMGKNVLYVAAEEGFGPTMKEKFDRLNAYHDNLHLTENMPDEIDKNYNIVFIDSVHSLKIGPEEMDELIKAVKENKISLVFIFHSTKEGSYRGATTNEHLIDISTKLESGLARHDKNRYNDKDIAYYVWDNEE